MERSHRMERVNDLLRSMLGPLITEKYASNDLVTIVSVLTARDLKSARVFVTATQNVDQHVRQLNKLAPELQATIKPQLDFKAIPALTFEPDTDSQSITQVENIIDNL